MLSPPQQLQPHREQLPVAQETVVAPFVVMGIPLQTREQARSVKHLMTIAIVWLVLVSIDTLCQLVYSLENSEDYHTCRLRTVPHQHDAQRDEIGDLDTYRRYTVIAYAFSFIVAVSIPLIGYVGARKRLRSHINVSFVSLSLCFITTLPNLSIQSSTPSAAILRVFFYCMN